MTDSVANTSGLRSALAALRIDGVVRSQGNVAVLVTSHPEQLAEHDLRHRAVDAAAQHGFRALAVELMDDRASDGGTTGGDGDAGVHRA